MADPILKDLNEQQQEAVMHGTGPLMVLAGAGSGKTRVVTRRIARLLRDGVYGSQILAMTFTNKAAGEMAHRVQDIGGPFVRIATFHSACARFLRADAHLLGYPEHFTIYDTYDRDAAIRSLLEDLGLDGAKVKPSAVGSLISKLKNTGLSPQDLATGSNDAARIVEKVWGPYHERMKQLGAMDFDDLLLNFLQLLKEHPSVAEQYRERFPWVLVDEFQDTNRVQYDLLRQLAPTDGNVCVVGDPDQSIYGFRGAEIRNILDFENDYENTKVVRLEQNYRSSAVILRAAESVIAHNKLRKDKRLRTDNEEGQPLLVFRAQGSTEEAQAIADRIQGLRGEDVELNQIAVFYRTHWLSRGIEQALKDRGIPYEILGGLSFFERREIKDLLAYLRVLVNPLDDVSMERIINVPLRGIGKSSVEKLKRAGFEAGMSLREAVGEPSLYGIVPPKARKALQQLASVLDAAREATPDWFASEQMLGGVCRQGCARRARSGPRRHAVSQPRDQPRRSRGHRARREHPRTRQRLRRIRREERRGPRRLLAAREPADLAGPQPRRRSARADDDGARCEGPRVRPCVRCGPRRRRVPEHALGGQRAWRRRGAPIDVRRDHARPPLGVLEQRKGAHGERRDAAHAGVAVHEGDPEGLHAGIRLDVASLRGRARRLGCVERRPGSRCDRAGATRHARSSRVVWPRRRAQHVRAWRVDARGGAV